MTAHFHRHLAHSAQCEQIVAVKPTPFDLLGSVCTIPVPWHSRFASRHFRLEAITCLEREVPYANALYVAMARTYAENHEKWEMSRWQSAA